MKITRAVILGSAAMLAAGATTAGAVTATPSQARATDGDADVLGKRVTLQAETTASTQRVSFRYGGKRFRARFTETDAEDRTKDWSRTVKALRSDRAPGRTVSFRVRACDGAGCSTTRITEVVEWDD